MAVNRLRYSQEIERYLAQGKTLEEAHRMAAEKTQTKKQKPEKKGVLKRLSRTMRDLRRSREYKKRIIAKRAEFEDRYKTARTKAIEDGLRRGGLTEEEIRRLRR